MQQRRITLLRHAKSDWSGPNLDDYDRPLNARGKHDAPRMGQQLRKRGLQPQLILSSPALRAITTARIVAAELGYEQESIQTDADLYHASPSTILRVLRNRGASYTDVMLVGHNPGLSDLANQIGDISIDNIPTCGAFTVELNADSWDTLGTAAGHLAWFDYPKNLIAGNS